MKASDIMTVGAATVAHDAPLSQAVRIMADHRISALPVLGDDGRLVGIVTETDFFRSDGTRLAAFLTMEPRARAAAYEARTVATIMTPNPTTIGAEQSIEEAVTLMADHSLKRLPVVTDGRVVGMLSRSDLLRAMIESDLPR